MPLSERRIYKLILILLSTVVIFSFNNCGKPNVLSDGAKVDKIVGDDFNGNGEGFEGKPDYLRLVPGYSCGESQAEHSRIKFSITGEVTYVNNVNACGEESVINPNDVTRSNNTDIVVLYENNIYAKEMPQYKNMQYTEAWCYSKHTSEYDFDLVIKTDSVTDEVTYQLFDKSKFENGTDIKSIIRNLTLVDRNVNYSGSNISLDIGLNRIRDSKGNVFYEGFVKDSRYEAGIFGVKLLCNMGGQFDSAAPAFTYYDNVIKVYPKTGYVFIKPFLSVDPDRFELLDELPEGVGFDDNTGFIFGKPIDYMKPKTYNVKAYFGNGSILSQVTFSVAETFVVNNLSSQSNNEIAEGCSEFDGKCNFHSAFVEANAKTHPVVMLLADGEIHLNEQLVVKNQIVIKGNVTFNGNEKTRIFHVTEGAELSLHNVSLINGFASHEVYGRGGGGAIYAEKSNLLLNNVNIINNKISNENMIGAGVFVSGGSLRVFESRFESNAIVSNGTYSSAYGGAIGISYSRFLSIGHSEFINNSGGSYGGAIYAAGIYKSVGINENYFEGNSSTFGGAISFEGVKLGKISNSIFKNNSAVFYGGSIFSKNTTRLNIHQNEFRENKAIAGLALYSDNMRIRLEFTNSISLSNNKFFDHSGPKDGIGVLPGQMLSLIETVSTDVIFKANRAFESSDIITCRKKDYSNLKTYYIDFGLNNFPDNSCGF